MKYKRIRTSNSSFLARRMVRRGRRRFFITIIIAGILFYSLVTWLLPNLIGGLSILNRFKTNPNTQTTINTDSTLAPPVLNIPYEATNSASISIKGYAQADITVEIYLDDELKSTTTTKEDGSFMTDPIELSLGTNNIFGQTVDEKGSKSLPSKTVRVILDNEKPKLDISSPQDNQEVRGGDKKVTVSGSTTSGQNIIVSANGIRLIVNSDGNFSQSIDLSEGENNITIVATDGTGNSTIISRKVIYTP